ncbi:hypothetical protein GCM10010095_85200 [Streptomyces anthocyanicus]|nr:hypothetical protein GCM10010095_85200 [Streptomyces anthocyanicus]
MNRGFYEYLVILDVLILMMIYYFDELFFWIEEDYVKIYLKFYLLDFFVEDIFEIVKCL